MRIGHHLLSLQQVIQHSTFACLPALTTLTSSQQACVMQASKSRRCLQRLLLTMFVLPFCCMQAMQHVLKQHAASSSSSSSSQQQDLVAIVDPPRAGLHKDVVKALLTCAPLKRLVYVSCNPDSLADNMAMLCSPPSSGED